MKKNTPHFAIKVIGSFFLFLVLFNQHGFAQNAAKSIDTTTINGKKYYLHKVSQDEIMYGISGISKTYNVDVNTVINENPSVAKGIMIGQELRIPMEKTTVSSSNQSPDLLSMVDDNTKKEKEYVTGTFKSTRNINFHTCEILSKRSLDFRISHRFGPINSGANNAWGVDGPANLMLSLEYSHNGRWMAGISRCIENKTAELFFKCKIIRQVKNGFPFTITYFGGAYHTSVIQNAGVPVEYYQNVADRLSYVNELIIACRITPWLSVQIAPAWVHYNLVDGQTPNTNSGYSYHLAKNDCVALTGVIRAKYNKRQAIIFEYAYRLNTNYASVGSTYYNSMGIGWEVETGGHVFQLFFTNSYGIMENSYLMTNTSSWKTSGIRLGFNITRVFTLGKKGV